MSVITPNETARIWKAQRPEAGIHLYLSGAEGEVADLLGARVLNLPLSLSIVPVSEWIDVTDMTGAAVAVVQVDADSSASIKRFEKLAASAGGMPLIAAAYEPPLALVRALLRSGAHDVLPLPLSLDDIETSIAPLRQQLQDVEVNAQARPSRLVTVIKGRGGCGATALLSQLACRYAEKEERVGRRTCLIDLDVQFGDAAFQLGLSPKLSLSDALAAGARLDPALLEAITVRHASGLAVIASPEEILPLEGITNDQVFAVIDKAQRNFQTVFVDLPANWTHWSLSLIARSDLVLLVTDLSVAGLRQARRQLSLLRDQELGTIPLEVVLNRFEKGLFKPVKAADVVATLGREARYTVANEPAVIDAAIDRGVPIDEIKRKSALGRDLDTLETGIVSSLGLER